MVLDPNNYDALYYLGTAYEDQGEYAKAIERYRAALAIKPENKDALHDLIVADLAEGRRDEASTLIPKLKELNQGQGRMLELLLKRSK